MIISRRNNFVNGCFICSLFENPHHEGAAYFMRDIIRD